ncbi:ethylbenzene dioxygenase beta subunit [Sphingopyxis panaciterrae]|uniref:3-phenylpropionate/cinnamic acid dioxygenase subunit beta n=1 Tax=Sphingopyxis panaciterrae TaxID=363841 RepID=UPI00141FD66F|nr:3-phenylpropionate/cinnamic acid dioxygenase subunit beta [Sphingopyxis panaciterrae]NIJ37711.1 ethylbenzene dioxygenase beta subunit [Sphingopyxis panaciterrae]
MSGAAASAKPDYSTYPTLDRKARRAAAAALLAMEGGGAPASAADLARIEAFYRMEARLLDEEFYDRWYDLLADDLFYWMPLRENRFRRDNRPSLSADNMAMFDETKADIAVRLGRLASNLVWTEDPPTRHVYLISNVEAFETGTTGEYEVHSAFVQYRNRSEHDEAQLVGRRRDLLRMVGDRIEVAGRLILFPQSVLLTKNLSAFF